MITADSRSEAAPQVFYVETERQALFRTGSTKARVNEPRADIGLALGPEHLRATIIGRRGYASRRRRCRTPRDEHEESFDEGRTCYDPHTRLGGPDGYPGEVSPSHRHTNAALRFIIEGDGAYTVVDGQAVSMEPGDFFLTPSWCWHGHTHEGSGPMLWLDVLDSR